ncbi:MAG: NAD(P)H-binding protein [Gammaproteobacteria bacterium]
MSGILVTGANGHLGRRLIANLPDGTPLEALVRSARARRRLERDVAGKPGLNVSLVAPHDATAVAALAMRCERAVHLIGTIRETPGNRYEDSHQRPARALLEAAARSGLRRIVYLSILGADAASESACLRARAAVENMLLEAAVPACIIRVPMVLGEGDRASKALARRARAKRVLLFRGESLEQPIYAGDVVVALRHALEVEPAINGVLELAGPESLTRAALVARAAAACGTRPRIHSLPLGLGLAFVGAMELLRARAPVTRDMLRVLDHDDAIDPQAAAATLGVSLTPLDTMLARCVGDRPVQDA